MSSSGQTVQKLYRSVIDDVINAVREDFLDDGVDEQVLHELKSTWERKLNESKAVDTPAKEAEPVQTTAKNNSKANNLRNAAANRNDKEHQNQQQNHHQHQQQQQQQAQPQAASQNQVHHIPAQQTVHLSNHQVITNQTLGAGAGPNMPNQLALHTTNFVGPSGIIYTTNESVDSQKFGSAQKLVLLQGLPGQSNSVVVASSAGGTLNLPPELLNQLAIQSGGVITHAPQTVVHHTNNVAQNALPATIQYANSSGQRQQPANNRQTATNNRIVQIDGADDSSEEEEDEDDFRDHDDDHDDNDEEINDEENEGQGEEEEPLNSEDDVSDEDAQEMFDTENVVVCQYDKITRSRNKWKFHLKDGIMNLQGKDFVFQRALGDAEW